MVILDKWFLFLIILVELGGGDQMAAKVQLNLKENFKSDLKFKHADGFHEVGNYCYITENDCLNAMERIETESVDLILTDPPYNLGQFMHERNVGIKRYRDNHFAFSTWDDLDYKEWLSSMDGFLSESSRVLKKKGALLLFMSLIKLETIISLAQKHGFYYKTTGVWHKTNPMPRNKDIHFVNSTEAWVYFIFKGTSGTFNNKGKLIHDFYETSVTPLGEKKFGKHPTQKPLSIVTWFVELLTSDNEVVLDPFMGSGTTGVVCERLKRFCYGIEVNGEYVDIAQKRITEA